MIYKKGANKKNKRGRTKKIKGGEQKDMKRERMYNGEKNV